MTPSMADNAQLSDLERHFPRIAEEFVKRWHTPMFEPFCYQLIVDERGNRKGFPAEVFAEILALYWLDLNLANFNPQSAFVPLSQDTRR
jgi:hypothetical protein